MKKALSPDITIEEQKGMQDDSRIASFLRGEMTNEDALAFEEELKKDEELRSRAVSIARLAKGMKEVGSVKDRHIMDSFSSVDETVINNVLRTTLENSGSIKVCAAPKRRPEQQKNELKNLPKIFRWMSVAASIVVILAVGLYYNDYRNTVSLGEKYADAFIVEQSSIRGSASQEIEEELIALFTNVQDGKDLKNTVHRLSILWEVSTLNTYNDYTDSAFYIGWNLAMGYLKLNDKENAIIVLSSITEMDSNEISEQASLILEKLK